MATQLGDLVPDFRDKVNALFRQCASRGVTMVPSEAVRSPSQQARYWRQSRSVTEINDAISMLKISGAPYLARILDGVGPQHGDEVTKVLPGNSWHQWGEAVDCFWEVKGKAEWSTTRKVNGVNGYQIYAQEAKDLGLNPGLLWRRFKDAPHTQLRADDNPRSSGMAWPVIDEAMRDRFGDSPASSMTERALGAATAAQDPIRLSYSAPEGWRVYETTDVSAAVFRGKMAICADGAPKAYNHNDAIALDYLANAGRPGNWWALVTDTHGNPVMQGNQDPAPGYYVSMTALINPSVPSNKPGHYMDATQIPYFVLPSHRYQAFTSNKILRLGDLGVGYNTLNGEMCFAQFCETGPATSIGEASIALANKLGVNSDPKNGGAAGRQIVYVIFSSTGIGRGLEFSEIASRTAPIFETWGGLARLRSYASL